MYFLPCKTDEQQACGLAGQTQLITYISVCYSNGSKSFTQLQLSTSSIPTDAAISSEENSCQQCSHSFYNPVHNTIEPFAFHNQSFYKPFHTAINPLTFFFTLQSVILQSLTCHQQMCHFRQSFPHSQQTFLRSVLSTMQANLSQFFRLCKQSFIIYSALQTIFSKLQVSFPTQQAIPSTLQAILFHTNPFHNASNPFTLLLFTLQAILFHTNPFYTASNPLSH